MTTLRALLFFAFALMAVTARAETLNSADQAAVTAVIERQLQAFANDDDAEAYAQAAPLVKFAFPNVETFMAMVKQGYLPVYRNNGYTFEESAFDTAGRPTQRVIIRGTDGKNHEALYTMEKQPDGNWKIAGCRLLVIPGQEV